MATTSQLRKGGSSSTSALAEASLHSQIHELRERESAILAKRDALRARIPPDEALTNQILASLVAESERRAAAETAHAYRMTGWSCFEVELTRGKRERARRNGKRKGVGVRLEVFCRERYHQPYYLIFACAPPPSDSDAQAQPRLEIPHHTIPHFFPLRKLGERYLGWRVPGEQEDEEGRVVNEVNMELFLQRVQSHLTAFVSRREQVLALREITTPIPASQRGSTGASVPSKPAQQLPSPSPSPSPDDPPPDAPAADPAPLVRARMSEAADVIDVEWDLHPAPASGWRRRMEVHVELEPGRDRVRWRLGEGVLGGSVDVQVVEEESETRRTSHTPQSRRIPQPSLLRLFFSNAIESDGDDLDIVVRRLRERGPEVDEDES